MSTLQNAATTKYCYIQPTGYHEKLYNFEKACRKDQLKRYSTWFDTRPKQTRKSLKNSDMGNYLKPEPQPPTSKESAKVYLGRTDPKNLPSNLSKVFNDKTNELDSDEDVYIPPQHISTQNPKKQKERVLGGGSVFDNLISLFSVPSPANAEQECECDNDRATSAERARQCPHRNKENSKRPATTNITSPNTSEQPSTSKKLGLPYEYAPHERPERPEKINSKKSERKRFQYNNIYQYDDNRMPKTLPIVVQSKFNNGNRGTSSQRAKPTVGFGDVPRPSTSSKSTPTASTQDREICHRLSRLEHSLGTIHQELDSVRSQYSHMDRFKKLENKFQELSGNLIELKGEYCTGQRSFVRSLDGSGERLDRGAQPGRPRGRTCCLCCGPPQVSSNTSFQDTLPADTYGEPVEPCDCGGKNKNKSDACCQCQHVECEVMGEDDAEFCTCGTFPSCLNHCEPCESKRIIESKLVNEINVAVGDRDICDVAITVIQRDDGIYQINVVTLEEPERVGCILATGKAVQEARDQDVFNYFLTFFLTDTRVQGAQEECLCGNKQKVV